MWCRALTLASFVGPPRMWMHREHVNQKHAVICACIVAAYRQVSMDELGRQFDLKKRREALAENGEGAEVRRPWPLR